VAGSRTAVDRQAMNPLGRTGHGPAQAQADSPQTTRRVRCSHWPTADQGAGPGPGRAVFAPPARPGTLW
jgi:hypothetical protein